MRPFDPAEMRPLVVVTLDREGEPTQLNFYPLTDAGQEWAAALLSRHMRTLGTARVVKITVEVYNPHLDAPVPS